MFITTFSRRTVNKIADMSYLEESSVQLHGPDENLSPALFFRESADLPS